MFMEWVRLSIQIHTPFCIGAGCFMNPYRKRYDILLILQYFTNLAQQPLCKILCCCSEWNDLVLHRMLCQKTPHNIITIVTQKRMIQFIQNRSYDTLEIEIVQN